MKFRAFPIDVEQYAKQSRVYEFCYIIVRIEDDSTASQVLTKRLDLISFKISGFLYAARK